MSRNDRPSFSAASGTKPLNSDVMRHERPASHSLLTLKPSQPGPGRIQRLLSMVTTYSSQGPHRTIQLPQRGLFPHTGTEPFSFLHTWPQKQQTDLCACTHLCVPSQTSLTWIPEHLLRGSPPTIHFSLLDVHCGLQSTSRIFLCSEAKLPPTQTSLLFNPIPSSMLTLDMSIYMLCRQTSNLNRNRNKFLPTPPLSSTG